MSQLTLDFLNKNMYRTYPLRSTSSHTFTDGRKLPTSLIVGLQLTTLYTYRKLYIEKIYAKQNFVSILIREVDTNIVVGNFSGVVTDSYTVLSLDPVIKEISGTLTIGNPAAIDLINGVGLLNSIDGRIEDSTIFCFTPPAVTSIIHKDTAATGFITLSTENITITAALRNFSLEVINPNLILSRADIRAEYGNCNTPLIKKINTVEPDNNGNIDIYGIDPVTIAVGAHKLGFDTTGLTLVDICPEKQKLSPPISDITDAYHGNILTTNTPEWKTWPEFS